jgi:hypothetical protein
LGVCARVWASALRLFAGSDFVSGACAASPELLVELCSSGDLERAVSASQLSDRLVHENRKRGTGVVYQE